MPVAPASRPRPATHHRSCGNQPAHIRLTNEVDQPGRPRPPRERHRQRFPSVSRAGHPSALDRSRSISRVGFRKRPSRPSPAGRPSRGRRAQPLYAHFRERRAAFPRGLYATATTGGVSLLIGTAVRLARFGFPPGMGRDGDRLRRRTAGRGQGHWGQLHVRPPCHGPSGACVSSGRNRGPGVRTAIRAASRSLWRAGAEPRFELRP